MNEEKVEVVGLTEEELLVVKEMAQDRLAVSRLWRKVKNFLLVGASLVVAVMTMVDGATDWIRAKLGF